MPAHAPSRRAARRVVDGDPPVIVALEQHQAAELGVADAGGILQHGVEHRLQLTGRAGDDLEHLVVAVCCSSDSEIVGALAQFVEQPRVLDGDHRLGGEVRDELDLLVGERSYLLAINPDRADQLIVFEHRHGKKRSKSAEADGCHKNRFAFDVGWFRLDIDNINRLSRFNHAAESGTWTGPLWPALPEFDKRWWHAELCSRSHGTILSTKQHAKAAVANANRFFQHRCKNWSNITGRTRDDVQHFGGCFLLLQRLITLAFKQRDFLSSSRQQTIGDDGRPLVHCRAFALPTYGVAFELVRGLLCRAVPLHTPQAQDKAS